MEVERECGLWLMARSSIKLTDVTRLLHLRHVYPQLGQITTHEGSDHFTQDFSHFSKTHLTPYYNNKQEEILYIYEATSWLLGKFCVDNHFVDLVYLLRLAAVCVLSPESS